MVDDRMSNALPTQCGAPKVPCNICRRQKKQSSRLDQVSWHFQGRTEDPRHLPDFARGPEGSELCDPVGQSKVSRWVGHDDIL